MNEAQFYQTVQTKSEENGINPLLLLSGIEGLYTFRDVKLNEINYAWLDSLILTIFALRIGDSFHSMAEANLSSSNTNVQLAAINELSEMTAADIQTSRNSYLKSFASMLQGKSPVRRYHEKALEVAALEIQQAQQFFGNQSIGIIILAICKDDPDDSLGLSAIFQV